MAADNINSLIQRVAGQSIGEIDHVIGELTRRARHAAQRGRARAA